MDGGSIAELFASFGPVRCRRMFGGTGIFSGELMFALEARGELYLKADERTREAFEREGCEPFSFDQKGRRVATSYWRVPTRLLDEPDELAEWARAALNAAQRATSAPKRKPVRSREGGNPGPQTG